MTTIATECNRCPKGIVRCTHLDGRVVWLVDEYLFETHDGQPSWDGVRFAAQGPGVPERCPLGCEHVGLPYTSGTDSLPDADAEYERRCALLRAEA